MSPETKILLEEFKKEFKSYKDYVDEDQGDASDRTGMNMNHCNCTSEGPAFDYVMYNNKRGYLYIYWGMGARDIAP